MRIPRKLKKKLKKIGLYEDFKKSLNLSFEDIINILGDNELLCECCFYNDECKKGVVGGPNGPIFPPCCDSDYCFDNELAIKIYRKTIKEKYIN